MIRLIKIVAACCVLGGFAAASYGQAFPSSTVRIIVPFPPGATTDIVAREIANQLGIRWSVPVIVENKAGASGTIGSAQIARAVGDPHLLMVTATHHVINPSLYKKLPYDPRRDFTSLALVASSPNVLIVNASFPPKTVADLIKLAKDRPGEIGFASTGIGGANHLSGELFQVMAGIKLFHIPYKGSSPAMSDLIAGHAPMMFAGLASVIPHLRAGRLRALGVTPLQRVPTAPEIPTLDEAGVKGFQVTSWFGLYGPPKLPPAALAKITSDVGTVLRSAHIKTSFNRQGVDPGTLSQAEFARFVEDEMQKWGRVIEEAKIPKQ